jgi:glycosyltransferase involved in cell wall biosynthesis
MNKKRGVLFVINDFNVGGAEVFILRLGKALQETYSVYITDINPTKSDVFFKQRYKNEGFEFVNSCFSFSHKINWFLWKVNAFFSLFGYKNFHKNLMLVYQKSYWKKVIKSKNIQVVNSHLIASDLFVYNEIQKNRKTHNFKWVVTMHSSYNPIHYQSLSLDKKSTFFERVLEIMNSCDAIVGVAEENFKIFQEVHINKTPKKIYLGYDAGEAIEEAEKKNNNFTILMIGRGMKEKGWEIAIKAFLSIKEDYPDAHLSLIGPLTEYMQNLKEKFECSQIHFEGYKENPVPYYKNANLSILPSFGESLPYSIIESLGYNLPVIVSNRGEMPEMIKNRGIVAGIVIEDDEKGLPSSQNLSVLLKELITNEEKYNELKYNTKEVFDQFSIINCVKQYLEIYKD